MPQKLLIITIITFTSLTAGIPAEHSHKGKWIQLFNGQNLEGWTPKFVGHETGVNYKNTFRVENGLLTVSYDEYEDFQNEFGHLFYEQPFSHYKLRAEYRFIGEQVSGGEDWAYRNNGLMLHAQKPETMDLLQDFPVSIEVQLLGGDGKDIRPTANLCTPGTNVVIDGKLITKHCTNSRSKTYHGNQWVSIEVVVRGDQIIHHIVEGDTVISYSKPQYDNGDDKAKKFIESSKDLLIENGYIAIQAESHPTQFRKIEVKPLE